MYSVPGAHAHGSPSTQIASGAYVIRSSHCLTYFHRGHLYRHPHPRIPFLVRTYTMPITHVHRFRAHLNLPLRPRGSPSHEHVHRVGCSRTLSINRTYIVSGARTHRPRAPLHTFLHVSVRYAMPGADAHNIGCPRTPPATLTYSALYAHTDRPSHARVAPAALT